MGVDRRLLSDSRLGAVYRSGTDHGGPQQRGGGWRCAGGPDGGAHWVGHSAEYEAKRYEGKIKEGNILISVHAEDSTMRDRAKTIFERAGAEDISYTEEKGVTEEARA